MVEKILVTGSNGTIGTELCLNLLAAGYEVVGADWRKNEWNKDVDALTINIDLRDKEAVLTQLPKDVDLIIHLAANARVYNLVVDPSLARDNFETTFNVLEHARGNNIGKVMFASSREVYGNSDKIVHAEDDSYVKNCESAYTASKIAGEALVHSYQQCYGINFVTFRFSNVYGKYDGSDRVIPLFISLCHENKDLTVFGEEKLLDFTYIDDVAAGITKVVQEFDSVKNTVYNLAYGEGTTILDVAKMIQEEMGVNNSIAVKDNRTGEVVKYIADISRAKKNFNYTPQVPIREGVKRAVAWYQENFLK